MALIKFPVVVVFAMLSLCAAHAAEQARDYPNRPVRIITGSPGSTSDIVPRFLASKLAGVWGQQIVVDNRPGAGSSIGAQMVARAAPDGFTLLLGNEALAINASLGAALSFDPLRDFAPISQWVSFSTQSTT